MTFHASYDVGLDDPAYDPIIDLQVNLGGPAEHSAILRAIRFLLRRQNLEARRPALGRTMTTVDIRALLDEQAPPPPTSNFLRPLPGPQAAFVGCRALDAELEGPAGSGKSMAIVMAVLRFLDAYPGRRVLILCSGPVPFCGAWTSLISLAPALNLAGYQMRCCSNFTVTSIKGTIRFVGGRPDTDSPRRLLEIEDETSLQGEVFHFVAVDGVERFSTETINWLKSKLRDYPAFFRATRAHLDSSRT